jgi:beta-fructofuranosidase
VLPGVEGDAMELEIVLDMQETEAVSIDVLRAPEKQEFTRVTVYRLGGLRLAKSVVKQVRKDVTWARGSCVTLDSTSSSTAADVNRRKPQSAEFIMAENNVMTLRIFVDRSIVEVFADNQTAVLTRVYPERTDSLGVSVTARGRPAKIVSLRAYPMENIWA